MYFDEKCALAQKLSDRVEIDAFRHKPTCGGAPE